MGLGVFGVLPIPDGTVGQADRQHLCGMYGGIAAVAGVSSVVLQVSIEETPTMRVSIEEAPVLVVMIEETPTMRVRQEHS